MQAPSEIHKKCISEYISDRREAVSALGRAFSQISDKAQAWQDLHNLTQDEDRRVRWGAAFSLGTAFIQIPDKAQAWQDLHNLTQDEGEHVRAHAAFSLGRAFSQIPDKAQAWQDLHNLTQDEDGRVRMSAADALERAFSQIPDKTQAWQDLHKLTQDEDFLVRVHATFSLGRAFSQIPDKAQAWQDLHNLTQDEDRRVRWGAAFSLGTAFIQIPDKAQAWQDLHNLTQDEGEHVRAHAAFSLGRAFSQIPDKAQAWQDLHNLTQDEDRFVRSGAADALGKAFSQVPDKAQAWQDLNKLTQDKNWFVRMSAYDSLGRASISKATESSELNALKNELENAINYFKKSYQESKDSPAKFCYTFYRSYLAIIFQEAKEQEVQKYLAEAQEAVGGSKSKDELLKAVENLARALQEAQRLKDRPFHEVVSELNTYRWFCEKAAEHMKAARDNAPGAVKLMKKCNPLLEDRIQSTIAEIQKSAREICESTHGSGTEYEALGAELQKAAKGLSTNDIAGVQNSSSKIVWQLKKFCHLLPPEDKEQVCTIVEEIGREAYYPDKLNKILIALLCLGPILESKPTSSQKEEETLQRIEAKLDVIHDNTKHLGPYLSNIEFAILKLKDSSGDAREYLFNIKNEIGKLQREIETQGLSEKELAIALENNDHALIERLTKMQEDISRAVRETTELNANKIDAEEILNELDEQNKLKKGDVIGIISDISQLLQIALKFYQTGSII